MTIENGSGSPPKEVAIFSRRFPCAACLALVLFSGCATIPVQYGPDVQLVRLSNGLQGEWFAGDLHAHSLHSDGDSSVATVVQRAQDRGLDFFCLTDHDTSLSGKPEHWEDPEYVSGRMVLLYGMEWTSKKGHANVLAAKPVDYSAIWAANRNLAPADAVRSAREQLALFSINHPNGRSCSWEYEIRTAGGEFVADAMEIWNGPFNFPNNNRETIESIWDPLLMAGLRVTGIGGSDNHQIQGIQSRANLHGAPTTWIYADELSAESVLAAIRAGHVTITYEPYGARLEFIADSDGDGIFESMMGDLIPAGGQTVFCLAAMGAFTKEDGLGNGGRYNCVVYKNGKVFRRLGLKPWAGEAVTFTDTPMPGDYYRAELRGTPDVGILQRLILGRTLAVTNPIYVGPGLE